MTQDCVIKGFLDGIHRGAYSVGYRIARCYWFIRRPKSNGASVAIWHNGQILLVRNSYASYFNLPGGNVRRHETALEAAVRELHEEIGFTLDPESLSLSLETELEWDFKQDHINVYEIEMEHRPSLRLDNREVIEAEFYSPSSALDLPLFPPIRWHIEKRLSERQELVKIAGD